MPACMVISALVTHRSRRALRRRRMSRIFGVLSKTIFTSASRIDSSRSRWFGRAKSTRTAVNDLTAVRRGSRSNRVKVAVGMFSSWQRHRRRVMRLTHQGSAPHETGNRRGLEDTTQIACVSWNIHLGKGRYGRVILRGSPLSGLRMSAPRARTDSALRRPGEMAAMGRLGPFTARQRSRLVWPSSRQFSCGSAVFAAGPHSCQCSGPG